MIKTVEFKDLISSNKGEIIDFKDRLSLSFTELVNSLISISNEIQSFRDIITPHIAYFYPLEDEPNNETFIKEVVIPNRDQLDKSINKVVKGMEGDVQINDNMEDAIKETLMLKNSVDLILAVIESIEIYSANTLIISVKAGNEGQALTKISEEVAQLSGLVNKISGNFRELVGKLDEAYTVFDERRRKIEIIYENYLTQMKVLINLVFRELINELGDSSKYVDKLMSFSEEVQSSLGNVISSTQIEDIVRQNLEKMIFFTEEVIESGDLSFDAIIGNGDIDRDRILSSIMLISQKVTTSVEESISLLLEGIDECMSQIGLKLSDVGKKFLSTDDRPVEEQNSLNNIYSSLEEMENRYIGYIEEIITRKRDLYEFSLGVLDIVNQFSGFFNQVANIARRFEVINMLTRIELARHPHLKRALGGALSGIRHLPNKIKKIIDESLTLYGSVKRNMEGAVRMYYDGFKSQDEILNGSIESIKKISLKLYESRKYYNDIFSQVGDSSMNIISLVESEKSKLTGFVNAKKIFQEINSKISDYIATELYIESGNLDSYESELQTIKGYIESSGVESDYKKQMLISLINELSTEKKEENVIIF